MDVIQEKKRVLDNLRKQGVPPSSNSSSEQGLERHSDDELLEEYKKRKNKPTQDYEESQPVPVTGPT